MKEEEFIAMIKGGKITDMEIGDGGVTITIEKDGKKYDVDIEVFDTCEEFCACEYYTFVRILDSETREIIAEF